MNITLVVKQPSYFDCDTAFLLNSTLIVKKLSIKVCQRVRFGYN